VSRGIAALSALAILAIGVALATRPAGPAPEALQGVLVFVSDREGHDELYLRRLPDGRDVRLTYMTEPVADPELSPDGRRVVFGMGGRIGLANLVTGEVAILTLGVDWSDGQPTWRPDGSAVAVVARVARGDPGEIHLLGLDEGGEVDDRHPLTRTPGLDESEPVFSPDGAALVFVRQGGLHLLQLADGLTRRLTTGLRECYGPRFLPSGELAYLWSDGQQFGLDAIELPTGARRTLSQGTIEYRDVTPSPDGRFLAATFVLDLRFRLRELLKPRPTEEIHLLDAAGRPVGVLARAWRYSNRSPDWRGAAGVESGQNPLL
jgi:Tol biopolymer transport system component